MLFFCTYVFTNLMNILKILNIYIFENLGLYENSIYFAVEITEFILLLTYLFYRQITLSENILNRKVWLSSNNCINKLHKYRCLTFNLFLFYEKIDEWYCMESYGNNDYEMFVGKSDVHDDSWSMRLGSKDIA